MKSLLKIAAVLLFAASGLPAHAQTPLSLIGATSGDGAAEAAQQLSLDRDLAELLRLLSDPLLVEKLKQQAAETASQPGDDGISASGIQNYFQETLIQVEARGGLIAGALTTVPKLYSALAAAWNESMAASESLRSAINVIIFLFGGFGLEWLYWSYLSATLKRVELSKPESYGSIVRAAMLRATLLFGSIAVFAFGSIGLFVAFEWSAFVEDIVISLLVGIIVMRLIIMIGVFVLAPNVDGLRLPPLNKVIATTIYRWLLFVGGIGLLGALIVDTIDRMEIAAPSLLAVEFIAALLFVAVLIGALWHANSALRGSPADADSGGGIEGNRGGDIALATPGNFKLVLSSAIILIAFLLWFADVPTLLWTLVAVASLFPAVKLAHVMVDHVFDHVEDRPPEAPEEEVAEEDAEENKEADSQPPPNRYRLYRPIVDRLIRFLLVIVAALTIGTVWDMSSILDSASNSLAEKVFGVVIDVVFALLIADLVWTWAKTAIEQKIATFPIVEPGHAPGPEARMATLLPMFEKVLMITIIVMVALIIISSLGVNIGPILAGAGVLGIALGFGAQALVKDIVSGVFILIDDAFRVGEYIEMGELRGTVESVSVRSLGVRHHRGALHTIPYGELSSVTNYSRDWAIMKLEFRVPFDTDLKLAKKIVKKVSANLQDNPDYGQYLIEPLKFQGVRRMEEFNMAIGVKFMAVPGEQWTIRRDSYQQILDQFEANGIKLASRNVQVEVISDKPLTEAEEKAVAGAAQDAVEQQMPAKPAPDEP